MWHSLAPPEPLLLSIQNRQCGSCHKRSCLSRPSLGLRRVTFAGCCFWKDQARPPQPEGFCLAPGLVALEASAVPALWAAGGGGWSPHWASGRGQPVVPGNVRGPAAWSPAGLEEFLSLGACCLLRQHWNAYTNLCAVTCILGYILFFSCKSTYTFIRS